MSPAEQQKVLGVLDAIHGYACRDGKSPRVDYGVFAQACKQLLDMSTVPEEGGDPHAAAVYDFLIEIQAFAVVLQAMASAHIPTQQKGPFIIAFRNLCVNCYAAVSAVKGFEAVDMVLIELWKSVKGGGEMWDKDGHLTLALCECAVLLARAGISRSKRVVSDYLGLALTSVKTYKRLSGMANTVVALVEASGVGDVALLDSTQAAVWSAAISTLASPPDVARACSALFRLTVHGQRDTFAYATQAFARCQSMGLLPGDETELLRIALNCLITSLSTAARKSAAVQIMLDTGCAALAAKGLRMGATRHAAAQLVLAAVDSMPSEVTAAVVAATAGSLSDAGRPCGTLAVALTLLEPEAAPEGLHALCIMRKQGLLEAGSEQDATCLAALRKLVEGGCSAAFEGCIEVLSCVDTAPGEDAVAAAAAAVGGMAAQAKASAFVTMLPDSFFSALFKGCKLLGKWAEAAAGAGWVPAPIANALSQAAEVPRAARLAFIASSAFLARAPCPVAAMLCGDTAMFLAALRTLRRTPNLSVHLAAVGFLRQAAGLASDRWQEALAVEGVHHLPALLDACASLPAEPDLEQLEAGVVMLFAGALRVSRAAVSCLVSDGTVAALRAWAGRRLAAASHQLLLAHLWAAPSHEDWLAVANWTALPSARRALVATMMQDALLAHRGNELLCVSALCALGRLNVWRVWPANLDTKPGREAMLRCLLDLAAAFPGCAAVLEAVLRMVCGLDDDEADAELMVHCHADAFLATCVERMTDKKLQRAAATKLLSVCQFCSGEETLAAARHAALSLEPLLGDETLASMALNLLQAAGASVLLAQAADLCFQVVQRHAGSCTVIEAACNLCRRLAAIHGSNFADAHLFHTALLQAEPDDAFLKDAVQVALRDMGFATGVDPA